MKGDSLGIISRALLAVGLVLLGPGTSLHADDTEIYQTTYNEGATGRPKVLIVIDDSGSMDTTVPGQRPAPGSSQAVCARPAGSRGSPPRAARPGP